MTPGTRTLTNLAFVVTFLHCNMCLMQPQKWTGDLVGKTAERALSVSVLNTFSLQILRLNDRPELDQETDVHSMGIHGALVLGLLSHWSCTSIPSLFKS